MNAPRYTPEQHAERGGDRCPNCGGENLDYRRYEIEAADGWQPGSCHDCGATWRDTYARKTDDLTADEVALLDAGDCPRCAAPTTVRDTVIEGGSIHVRYDCDDCDARYFTEYPMTGYIELNGAGA